MGTGSNDRPSPDADPQNTDSGLLPMLIGGLVLIVIGAVVVMSFV
jgi:hypothetical protein